MRSATPRESPTAESAEQPRASIAGKVATVTGAGQGNGRAIALRLAREGASIFASDLQRETLAELAAELGRIGVDYATGIYDAANVTDAARFIDGVIAKYGRIDVAVNNAGAIRAEPFPHVSEETWDWNVNLNMKGLYFYMQEEAKRMMLQRSGRIINISSISGLVGGQTLSPPYAASKGAVVNLTQTAAAEMAQYGVTVNAVAPGMVDTAFSWKMDEELGVKGEGLKPGEFLQRRGATIPLGRLGQPEEIANAVAFLASDEAAYITGETLVVSGGMLMH